MASEHIITNEAVAEASRVAIQVMATATTERPQSVEGPQIGRPAMKQPSFTWEAEDKYSELKNFRLEVNNILASYNMTHVEQLAIVKNWLRQERPAIHRILKTKQKKKNVTQ